MPDETVPPPLPDLLSEPLDANGVIVTMSGHLPEDKPTRPQRLGPGRYLVSADLYQMLAAQEWHERHTAPR